MYKELIQQNHDKAKIIFAKKTELAHELGDCTTSEAAQKVIAQIKANEEEAKKNDEELGLLMRYQETHLTSVATKKIGLTP